MRSILLILLTIFFCLPAFSQEPLKATVTKEWTVDTAREEAFKNVEYTKDLSEYPAIDPNLIENRIAIQNKQEKIGNRRIAFFSNGTYSVVIMEEGFFDKVFHYKPEGILVLIDFDIFPFSIKSEKEYDELLKNRENYPMKSYSYYFPSGEFEGVVINVDENRSFTFKSDGKLDQYRIKDIYYNPDGTVLGNMIHSL